MKKLKIIIILLFVSLCSFLVLLINTSEYEEISLDEGSQKNPINMENTDIDFDEKNDTVSGGINNSNYNGFYYNKMTKDMQKTYEKLYEAILLHKKEIKIDVIKEDVFKRIFYSLKFDNPELIHLSDKYSYDSKDGYIINFYPTYTMDKKEYNKKIKEINTEASKIKVATKDLNNYEKELFIHDYILKRCNYNLSTKNQDNMYGSLIEGQAGCRGYSAAFTYLLNVCGIKSGQIIGTVIQNDVTEGHSWNFLILEGEYYYADICWNDIAMSADYTDIDYHYAFLNMTFDEIKKTHNFMNQKAYLYPVEETNNGEYSFYKSNGLYAYTYKQACDIINTKLPLVLKTDLNNLTIQCDSKELYNELNKNITGIIKDTITNDKLNIKYCKYTKIESGNTIIIHDFVY